VEEGIAIWDAVHGLERVAVALDGQANPWFEPHSGDLFTNNERGLFRWPRRVMAADHVRFGPPQRWTERGHFVSGMDGSADGKLIVVSGWPYRDDNLGFRDGQPCARRPYGPHKEVRTLAVSGDGRFVATSGHGDFVKVWDGPTGALLHDLSFACGRLRFSHDSRWLLTLLKESATGVQAWEAGSWLPRWTQKAEGADPLAISPDDQLIITSRRDGLLCLISSATGRTLARLEDPERGRANFLTFSPDGGKIIVLSNDNQALHVWDLRLVRRGLVELGLDWEGPPLPEEEAKGKAKVNKVEVIGAELVIAPKQKKKDDR
jgi:hypothetical protein